MRRPTLHAHPQDPQRAVITIGWLPAWYPRPKTQKVADDNRDVTEQNLRMAERAPITTKLLILQELENQPRSASPVVGSLCPPSRGPFEWSALVAATDTHQLSQGDGGVEKVTRTPGGRGGAKELEKGWALSQGLRICGDYRCRKGHTEWRSVRQDSIKQSRAVGSRPLREPNHLPIATSGKVNNVAA